MKTCYFFSFIIILVTLSSCSISAIDKGTPSDTSTGSLTQNTTDTIDIFDDSIVHTISLSLTQNEYDQMIERYKNSSEKEYVKTNIIIDGVEIQNVGVRLKGNLTLRQALGTDRGGPNKNGSGSIRDQLIEESGSGSTGTGSEKNPGLLIKFDEFDEDTSYQGLEKIALRIASSDASLAGEAVAYSLFETAGYPAPEVSYADVTLGESGRYLYLISEIIDENYIMKHYNTGSGELYKAENNAGFHYTSDNEDDYVEKFDQEMNKKTTDYGNLIKILQFVTNSTQEVFDSDVEKYIDMDSVLSMLAIDTLVGNPDGLAGFGSNYHIYIDSDGIAHFVTWDQNLAFGGLGGGGMGRGRNGSGMINPPMMDDSIRILLDKKMNGEILTEEETKTLASLEKNMPNRDGTGGNMMGPPTMNGSGNTQGRGNMGNTVNDLKTKIFASKKYTALYNEKLEQMRTSLFISGKATDKLNAMKAVFFSYADNALLVDTVAYTQSIEKIQSYIDKAASQIESDPVVK